MEVERYVDLHCHWVAAIDDGVKTVEGGIELLSGLGSLGFSHVVATPHMRPGMFDNDKAALVKAFAKMSEELDRRSKEGDLRLPERSLGSEHFFDDIVFARAMVGDVLPYSGSNVFLVEFSPRAFPKNVQARLFDLRRTGLSTVIAHPERYEPVWKDVDSLEPLLDSGAFLLLDICALVGKYGRAPQEASMKLIELDLYDAACSDAHKPEDLKDVEKALNWCSKNLARGELDRLFRTGPETILRGSMAVPAART